MQGMLGNTVMDYFMENNHEDNKSCDTPAITLCDGEP